MPVKPPGSFQAGQPAYGNTVGVVRASIAFGDTSAKNLFTLPKGAVVVGISVVVATAFNDGASNVLDIGISGTAEKYATNLDVTTVNTSPTTGIKGGALNQAPLTAPEVVQGIFVPGTSASTGLAYIFFYYILE